ncbi:MAG: dehydratase [Betaproteobacteria bacterium]|nr:dehydratase [Betaproteobacteria bacterium]MBM5802325.1 dehydratase [Cyanobacteria bacterium K_DeepCast_35m_m2_023]
MRGLSDFKLGDRFESPESLLEESEALAFARRFDPQAFHLDEAAARQSPFKGLAVSGWFTAAVCFRLIHDSGIDLRGGIIGQKIEDLQWLRPVRPGDRLRVQSTVVQIHRSAKSPHRGTLVFEHLAFNQVDEQVLLMRAHVLASDPPAQTTR